MITIGLGVLEAVARFASDDEKNHPHMCGVCINAEEIAATDGHRLVRVHLKKSHICSVSSGEWAQQIVVPRTFVAALVAVGRSTREHQVRIAMASQDKIHAMVGGVEMFYPASKERFPPIDQILMRTQTRGQEPPRRYCVDASFFADVDAVVQAVVGPGKGVSIASWGVLLDPIHLDVEDIVRFVLMPMSSPEATAEAKELGPHRR